MSRPGAVTFKGNPMTLAGEAVKVGQPAPDFKLHAYENGGHEDDHAGRSEGQADVHQRRSLARHAGLPGADQEVQRATRGAGRQDQRADGEPGFALRHEPVLRRREDRQSALGQRLSRPLVRQELGNADRGTEDPGPRHVRVGQGRQSGLRRDWSRKWPKSRTTTPRCKRSSRWWPERRSTAIGLLGALTPLRLRGGVCFAATLAAAAALWAGSGSLRDDRGRRLGPRQPPAARGRELPARPPGDTNDKVGDQHHRAEGDHSQAKGDAQVHGARPGPA